MNKLERSHVQHGDYIYQYSIVYLKSAKRINLQCFHHKRIKKKENGNYMIDGYVN